MLNGVRQPGSFRDPSGFVFRNEDGVLLRQVNASYETDYRQLMDGGLYEALVSDNQLVAHEEVPLDNAAQADACCVIRPHELPYISYPYEWAFSGLKAAALLTLDIQLKAMSFGMTLKDAASYNVQFEGTQPVFIDTLSFERYQPGSPWQAYGQFCRHFLAPLALMSKTDISLGRLMAIHLDGIDLTLAEKLLPWTTRLRLGLLVHLHLHARMTRRYSDTSKGGQEAKAAKKSISESALKTLIQNLRETIVGLKWHAGGTTWADYYENNSYSDESFEQKQQVVREFLEKVRPEKVWDLGANTGVFSRIACQMGAATCAFDVDPACVELNFQKCQQDQESHLLPLLMDLTNPSAGIGWAHKERDSLVQRGPTDTVLSLALIHHLAISNNVPLDTLAEFFSKLGNHLIIEFVPKNDPQVQRLLRSRKDIFDQYHQQGFEDAFQSHFDVLDSSPIGTDGRVLYLLASHRSIEAL